MILRIRRRKKHRPHRSKVLSTPRWTRLANFCPEIQTLSTETLFHRRHTHHRQLLRWQCFHSASSFLPTSHSHRNHSMRGHLHDLPILAAIFQVRIYPPRYLEIKLSLVSLSNFFSSLKEAFQKVYSRSKVFKSHRSLRAEGVGDYLLCEKQFPAINAICMC